MYDLLKNNKRIFGLFDEFFSELPQETKKYVSFKRPKVNVSEKESEFIVDVFYPGVKKENFKIQVEESILTISSNFKDDDWDTANDNVFSQEYTMYDFSRRFKIPKDVVIEKIGAVYENGVLAVKIPKDKKKEKERIKEIKIE